MSVRHALILSLSVSIGLLAKLRIPSAASFPSIRQEILTNSSSIHTKYMEVPQGHEAAQTKPPANAARPWRGGGGASASAAAPPPPPKVYRVEPREFRDLVQRLTGAPPTALRPRPQHHQHRHRAGVAPPVQPQPVRAADQQAYGAAATAWFSFPMEAAAQPQHGAGAFL